MAKHRGILVCGLGALKISYTLWIASVCPAWRRNSLTCNPPLGPCEKFLQNSRIAVNPLISGRWGECTGICIV